MERLQQLCVFPWSVRRKDIDLETRTARLAISSSKNKEPWVLPLAGTLWEIIERRLDERRLDCPYVFHYRNGKKIGDFRKKWAKACESAGLVGVIPHDLRRCAARNLSLSGVREQLAMRITGHKTNSMYRRYRIVDEDELRQAQEQQQVFLKNQTAARKVCPAQNRDLGNVDTGSKRHTDGEIRFKDGLRALTRRASD